MKSDWGKLYIVETIILKDIKYCPHILKKNRFEKYINFGPTRVLVLGVVGKNDIWM